MMEDSDPISREDVSIPSKITQPLQQLEDTYLTSKALSDKNNEEIDAVDGRFILKKTPGQMVQVRDDQVRNSAGGFVFKVNDETRIRRFLILGTNGGTYYSSEKELTISNISDLIEIIEKGKASLILKEIYEISLAGRNPKQDSLLFSLALCARYRVHDARSLSSDAPELLRNYTDYLNEMHKAALSIVNDVCRIPTHLFSFVEFCELVSRETNIQGQKKSTGWGRLMRRTITQWYVNKTPEQLALHLTKYPQRGGWSHRDLFRLAHPTILGMIEDPIRTLEYEQLFRFAVKGNLNIRKRKLCAADWELEQPQLKYNIQQLDSEMDSSALNMVEAIIALKQEKDETKVVAAIEEHRLVREHIPTEMLSSVSVWQALLKRMPITAIIRNLGKMQSIGVLIDAYRDHVISQLNSEDVLKKARVHPIQILLAKTVYESGHGDRGNLTWEVDNNVNEALENAFYKAFVNVPTTNKRFCFAFDVSGSMCSNISNTMLSCRAASAALSLVSLRKEKLVECVGFCHNLIELPFKGDWKIQQIIDYMSDLDFGATDCALPMLWAKENEKQFDVFVVYTDCETYFGAVHPFEALRQYRESSGINAKLVVMGMTSTGFTIADPTDAGMLDIVGFDSAVPQLLNDFIQGKF